MLTPFIMGALTIALIALAWTLTVAETALTFLSRKQAEGIALRKPKNPILTVMSALPVHLNALRFWSLFAEMSTAVMVALLLDYFLDNLWAAAGMGIAAMVFVCLLLVIWSPRTVGSRYEVATAQKTAQLVRALTAVLGPLAVRFAAPRFGAEQDEEQNAEIEERHFREYVSRANDADVLEDAEAQLIRSVFDMGDTIVRAVMVPRTDLVTVDTGTTLDNTMNLFLRSGNSRMPLIGDDADSVLGMVYLKDVARALHTRKEDPSTPVDTIARETRFVPESKTVSVLLQELQREATHVAIVVDEYGGTAGLVTLEDLIEEIVGDISDEYDTDDIPNIEVRSDDEFMVNSRMSVTDFADIFDLDEDAIDSEDVDTVGGLLAKHLGMVPIEGSKVELSGMTLIADRLEGRRNRVSTIRVIPSNKTNPARQTDSPSNTQENK